MNFLGEQLQIFETLQKEWKMERPFRYNGITIGFMMINSANQRRFFVGDDKRGKKNKKILSLPLDIISFCRERGWTIIITNGEGFYEVNCKFIHWGKPFEIKEIQYVYVYLVEEEMREIKI